MKDEMVNTMVEPRFSNYEGMFLFPQAMAARLQEAIEHINTLLDRAGAELLAMQKWGERPLAYPIDSHRRGIYILTYFKCDRSKLADLERDCNLSETLLRSLVTRADHLTVEEITAYDQREELHVEAKLRADKAAAGDQVKSAAVEAVVAPEETKETPATPEPVSGDEKPSEEAQPVGAGVTEQAPTEDAESTPTAGDE